MDLNKGYASVFKNRGVDVVAAYDVAVAEVAAALHLGGDEVVVWLDSYSGRLFGAEMLAYVSNGSSDFEIQLAVRRVMHRWLWRKSSMAQQESGAPEDTSYLMAAVLLTQVAD